MLLGLRTAEHDDRTICNELLSSVHACHVVCMFDMLGMLFYAFSCMLLLSLALSLSQHPFVRELLQWNVQQSAAGIGKALWPGLQNI